MQEAQLNYDIYDKEMLAIILALEEWRAKLKGIQIADPFLIYLDYRALEYFMTTKKLSARQARQAEYLSRYHFRLIYYIGKANEQADALSKKHEDVKEQDRAIEEYKTQVLLPYTKIDLAIVQDLQLALVKLMPEEATQLYDSIQLLDKILIANRTSLKLEELRTKARFE